MRHLALVLTTSATADFATARDIALAARARDIEVSVFFMDDGVGALPAHRDVVDALDDEDCELIACALSAHERQLGEDDVGMLLGSQDDHAAFVHRADRVLAFG